MSIPDCCVTGFQWDGTAEGREVAFPTTSGQAYVVGRNTEAAVMLIHHLFGWKYANIRLLADHLAKEADVTVYVPDFFDGEQLSSSAIEGNRWDEIDFRGFLSRNGREAREPEIFACARKLRSEYKKFGAIGYCYGGWAVFRLAAAGNDGLVDCISAGHPSLLTHQDIDEVGVPVQVIAPEHDQVYTEELRAYTLEKLQEIGVFFDYQYFTTVKHGCLVRGSPHVMNEREAMRRGKDAAVKWFRRWLHDEEDALKKR